MDHTKDLTQQEKELYDKLRQQYFEEMYEKSPNAPVYKVAATAWESFLNQRWTIEGGNNYLSLGQEDLAKLASTCGPDLTALPRKRYAHIKGKVAKAPANRPPNKYSLFVKEMCKTEEVKNIPNAERMKYIAQKWNERKEGK